jgi:uncharacterized membrane protein YheB (UPF0754 family)
MKLFNKEKILKVDGAIKGLTKEIKGLEKVLEANRKVENTCREEYQRLIEEEQLEIKKLEEQFLKDKKKLFTYYRENRLSHSSKACIAEDEAKKAQTIINNLSKLLEV